MAEGEIIGAHGSTATGRKPRAAALGFICGFGSRSYILAMEYLNAVYE